MSRFGDLLRGGEAPAPKVEKEPAPKPAPAPKPEVKVEEVKYEKRSLRAKKD